ncbi:OLC1v1018559C1 [Oldenlandia corymbosa var. corymbosa]|uniref:OLC1v1018559C1 n=1 Tax=Oldenlandia corymbosa var. corymbosa TaxID=529605 RepID=A0AAV1EC83_OLDCO|nr:OLC1v1018559C1 [Oldenlandia corymbosa var. corymbosa]
MTSGNMTSLIPSALNADEDLDDAALWAAVESAADAASLSASSATNPQRFVPLRNASPVPAISRTPRIHRNYSDGEVLQESRGHDQNHRPPKIARSNSFQRSPQTLAVVKHVPRTPTTPPVFHSPEARTADVSPFSRNRNCPLQSYHSPVSTPTNPETTVMRHSLSGRFPTVSLFKEYQDAAMAILEKSDYTMISGHPFIKKTGWRKIAFYFNLSFEIKDKTIEFDEHRNVQRAEFIVRAHMHGGRFSDGWGSCEKREKKFMKPNHDIPSTAETRAKNKACQDLLGIGEYRPGGSHGQQ